MYLLDAEQALKKRRAVKRKRDVLKIGEHFTEPCLCFLASNPYFLENSLDHHLEYLEVLLVEILLLIVKFIQHDLQI